MDLFPPEAPAPHPGVFFGGEGFQIKLSFFVFASHTSEGGGETADGMVPALKKKMIKAPDWRCSK